jgi:hypothetical protein
MAIAIMARRERMKKGKLLAPSDVHCFCQGPRHRLRSLAHPSTPRTRTQRERARK